MLGVVFRWQSVAVFALLFGASAVVAIGRLSSPHSDVMFGYGAMALAALLAAGIAFFATRRLQRGDDRLPWRFFTFAALAAGGWVWLAACQPSPGAFLLAHPWAFLLFLGCHYLLYSSLVLYDGRVPAWMTGRLVPVCDLLLALGAAAGIGLFNGVHNNGYLHAAPPVTRVMAWGYLALVLIGIALLTLLLSRVTASYREGPRWVLALGVACILAGDVTLLMPVLAAQAVPQWCLVAGWSTGFLLCAAAAVWEGGLLPHAHAAGIDEEERLPYHGMVLPALLLLALLVLGHRQSGVQGAGQLTLALTLLLPLLLARIFLLHAWQQRAGAILQHKYAECRQMMLTDPLTGLANKQACLEKLKSVMNRSLHTRRPAVLLFADIDFFKLINDTHGHPVGDKALIAVGQCLRRQTRATDLVARFGGEEFVLLLADTALEQGRQHAERLRKAVELMQLRLQDGPTLRMTISLGVAAFPDSSHTPEDLLLHADDAMNQAKNIGRNRVVIARRHPASGEIIREVSAG